MELTPPKGRSARATRRMVQAALATATLLAGLAVASPASAWPMTGW